MKLFENQAWVYLIIIVRCHRFKSGLLLQEGFTDLKITYQREIATLHLFFF